MGKELAVLLWGVFSGWGRGWVVVRDVEASNGGLEVGEGGGSIVGWVEGKYFGTCSWMCGWFVVVGVVRRGGFGGVSQEDGEKEEARRMVLLHWLFMWREGMRQGWTKGGLCASST